MDELDMHMNYMDAEEHEPVADHNNNMVRDCTISIFHSLPFIMTPNLMVSKLINIATKPLN